MSKSAKLTILMVATFGVMMSAVQSKAMPPRVYRVIQTTVVLIGTTSIYDGIPANSIDWAY
jgi:hypothetical protein